MELHNLKPAKGSTKNKKRIGRGQGSGRGGTSTRGHKGAKSRSGYKSKRGFEGGQMPLQRRIPKRGFNNINRVDYQVFNVSDIQKIVDKFGWKEFTFDLLKANNLVKKNDLVKILGNGNISNGVPCKAHKISESAKSKLEAAGGSIELI